jgi:tRNA dimethylallyltransferase
MAAAKTVIILAGPTGVGKTAMAIRLARHFNTEIISADSRQCYKELDVGVARPSSEELALVKHHFIASHSIHEKINAAAFEQYALKKTKRLFHDHDVVIMVGGTGLYLKAFSEGLDDMPDVPENIRNEIHTAYQLYGLAWLQQQVARSDPDFYEIAEQQNPHRLMRALEVVKATGRSVLSFRSGIKVGRDFRIIKGALELPRAELYQRINHRVDEMIERGLVEETRSLIPYQHLNALQTVGYKELFAYFAGECSLSDAVGMIKQNTRHYAKRQMTWFRKDKTYQWFSPHEQEKILTVMESELI